MSKQPHTAENGDFAALQRRMSLLPEEPVAGSAPISQDMLEYVGPMAAALHRRGPRSARTLLLGICVTFGVFVLWAAFATLEETVRAQGKVIPAQRVQHIQNLEGGILREIAVTEGELVEKDSLLLRIDNEQANSRLRDAQQRIFELQASIAVHEALVRNEEPVFPPELVQADSTFVEGYISLWQAKRTQQQSEKNALEEQLSQRTLEALEQEAKLENVRSSLPFVLRQRDLAKRLLASKSYSEMEYLNLEQKVAALQGEQATLEASLPRTKAFINEAQERLHLHKAQSDAETIAASTKEKADLASLRELLVAGVDTVNRTEVRSPVRGVVKRINLTTAGGVIKPGDNIMDIVPIDDTLIIEAGVSPQDIAFLFVGQTAKVRLTSYDFSVYGALDATLEHISADTMENASGEIFYLIKLRTETGHLTYNGKPLAILPGMQATVDIVTGKKTVLTYLMKPILRAKQAALRER